MQQNNPTGYWFRERQTKKRGAVIDVYFYIVNQDGKEVQKCLGGFENKTLARKAYREFMSTYVAPPKKTIYNKQYTTFENAGKQYVAYCKSTNSPATYLQVSGYFDKFYYPIFKTSSLEKIKEKDVYQWQDWLWCLKNKKNDNYYADNTLTHIRARLHSFFEWCRPRYGTSNPMELIKKPNRRNSTAEITFWEKTEFDTFILAVEHIQWKTLFMFLYYSGCRIGEVLALKETDFKKNSIHINKSLSKKAINGERYNINAPKNKKNRDVPIPTILVQQLTEYISWKRQNNVSDKFLFVGKDGDYLPHTTIRTEFDVYTKLAHVKRIRIHDMRHSYVSLLIHKGANFTVIAELVGDNLEQITKTYGHMYVSDKTRIIDLLN